MVLLSTILIDDLKGIFLRTLMSFFLLVLWGLGISSSCDGGAITRPLMLSLVILLLLFSSGFVKGLLGLGAFFELIGLIFGLWGRLISLIVPRIETHLQGIFLFRVPLI